MASGYHCAISRHCLGGFGVRHRHLRTRSPCFTLASDGIGTPRNRNLGPRVRAVLFDQTDAATELPIKLHPLLGTFFGGLETSRHQGERDGGYHDNRDGDQYEQRILTEHPRHVLPRLGSHSRLDTGFLYSKGDDIQERFRRTGEAETSRDPADPLDPLR